MQEERDHKGLLGMVRGLIFEDVPEEGAPAAPPNAVPSPPAKSGGKGSDDVDRMFADIEAEVGNKSGRPSAPKAAPAGQAAAAPPAAMEDVVPPDVRKIVKMIDALPSVLTQDQVKPLLVAMMDAANLSAEAVALQADDGAIRARDGIAAAGQEIARLEADREETLARLAKLMETARMQCAEGVAAQQARIAGLTAALNTLERVVGFLPANPAQVGTEKKS